MDELNEEFVSFEQLFDDLDDVTLASVIIGGIRTFSQNFDVPVEEFIEFLHHSYKKSLDELAEIQDEIDLLTSDKDLFVSDIIPV